MSHPRTPSPCSQLDVHAEGVAAALVQAELGTCCDVVSGGIAYDDRVVMVAANVDLVAAVVAVYFLH